MAWKNLEQLSQLEEIAAQSVAKPQIIFKHSTRCSVSVMVKNKLEGENFEEVKADFYYLDLLSYREISNAIAQKFHVYHESPQVLVIKNGESVYDESHLAITFDDLVENCFVQEIKN